MVNSINLLRSYRNLSLKLLKGQPGRNRKEPTQWPSPSVAALLKVDWKIKYTIEKLNIQLNWCKKRSVPVLIYPAIFLQQRGKRFSQDKGQTQPSTWGPRHTKHSYLGRAHLCHQPGQMIYCAVKNGTFNAFFMISSGSAAFKLQ